MPTRLVDFADHYWHEYLDKIERAVAPLDETAIWARANERSNAIANLLLHLRGNLAQWILEGLGGVPSGRQRSQEFAARRGEGLARGRGKEDLLADLRATVERCLTVVRGLSAAEMARVRTIQTYEVDGHRALFHTVEHMSYHTGQIVLLAKQLLPAAVALEFYPQHRGE